MLAYLDKLLNAFTSPPPVVADIGSDLTPESHTPQARLLFEPRTLVEPLTERELEVLGLIAAGRSNAVIAEQLVVTVGTVKSHLKHIYSKLAVGSRTQAVAQARQLGLI
ncbi:MAG TPA: response regulator transcription factor, partial [Caldilineaceae bacterium]|nr:response regulator transcription factor [Caldilineaceae bacterium]